MPVISQGLSYSLCQSSQACPHATALLKEQPASAVHGHSATAQSFRAVQYPLQPYSSAIAEQSMVAL